MFEKYVDSLVKQEIVEADKKDLYIYGLQYGLLMVVNIITVMIIGAILKMTWQSIFFMVTYIPIRSYAGGYHSKTQLRCYLFSIVIMTVALLGIKHLIWTGFIYLIITLVAGTVIFILAPVENRNKPFDQLEVVAYRRKTRILLGGLIGLASIAWFIGIKEISVCITMALMVLSVMLVLGKVQNVKINKSSELKF